MDLLNLDNIDKTATKDKVDALLKCYHRFRRLSGRQIEQSLTQQLSFMPRPDSTPQGSEIEFKVQRKIDAERLIKDINKAINAQELKSRRRLTDKYIEKAHLFDYEIYSRESISETTYYRELSKAQIGFAESYRDGELLVYVKKMGEN